MLTLLRFLKLFFACAYVFAALAATFPAEIPLATRRRLGLAIGGLSFGGTWICGFWLAAWMEYRFLSTWVVGSLVLSLLSLQGVLFASTKERESTRGAFWLTLVSLLGILALMVWRPR